MRFRKKQMGDSSIMVEEQKVTQLKSLISDYLKSYTLEPAMKSIDENIFVAYRLGNILIALKESERLIGGIGYHFNPEQSLRTSENDIRRLEVIVKDEECSQCEIDFVGKLIGTTCSKKCLMPYIQRQVNWIIVSIFSASYLSSMILLRSVFEILVNLSATVNGGMSKRIDSMRFIQHGEKKKIKKIWRGLSSWSHPFEKWLREMCPIYVAHKPVYHQKHFEECVDLLEKITDLYLVVCGGHFGMDVSLFANAAIEHQIDLSNFPLFEGRIESGSK